MRTSAVFFFLQIFFVGPQVFAAEFSSHPPNSRGEATYQRFCSMCHRENSDGDPDFFPSLINAAKRHSPEQLVRVILNGRYDIAESDVGHNVQLMPPWDHLANEDIAALANYLYSKANLSTQKLTADDVAKARGEHWTAPQVPLANADFERASHLYFDRCAGCHGVDRQGSAGNPLTDWLMRSRGDAHIREILHYGTPWGMPNWGTTEQISAEEMSLLSRFLQRPAPEPPPFSAKDIRASWQLLVPIAKRPKVRQFSVAAEDLFVSMQHDTGRLLLINGNTKQVVTDIQVGIAPHDIDLSLDGRYLYVICRDGHVVLIDLFMQQPGIVARVRVGLEARSVAVSQTTPPARVVAGAYWPGQFSILKATTLEPIKSKQLGRHGARISQVTNLPKSLNYLLNTKDTNDLYLLNTNRASSGRNATRKFETPSTLRGGSFDSTGRYFLTPTQAAQVVIFDSKRKRLMDILDTPQLLGGNVGVSYNDTDYGPAWASSSMNGPYVVAIGTDPRQHPNQAWRVIREIELPSAGSLFIATHPNSSNLWIDLPLSATPSLSESVFLVDLKMDPEAVHRLSIAEWAGLDQQQARVLHPQYNAAGDEVWLTVWSRQDRPSAIVVIDDKTRKLKQVIRDQRLVTPIRTFSLGAILQRRRGLL